MVRKRTTSIESVTRLIKCSCTLRFEDQGAASTICAYHKLCLAVPERQETGYIFACKGGEIAVVRHLTSANDQ